MYFKEKEDTNIDKEFEGNRKKGSNFDFNKLVKNPKILLIGGGILVAIIVIVAVIWVLGNKSNYTIELEGSDIITIIQNEKYVEPGYKAYDKKGNDCTEQVEITSNVDTTKVDTYEILYSIGGINKVRYVNVVEPQTSIHLIGEKNICLPLGTKYDEPGYKAIDSIDGDISNKVIPSRSVDHKKEGIYKIIYSVTNSRNQTTEVTRNVRVAKSC